MTRPVRLTMALTLGLLAGLGGEALLFLERQCWRIESVLADDFRVLLFLRSDLEAGRQKVLEEQLRALPEVTEVRGVSRQEALAALRREEPDLVESFTGIADNPLLPAFEVRLGGGGLGRVPQWIAEVQPLSDWADIRYKPAEIQAMLQAQFYRHFINLALNAAVCVASAMVLIALWSAARPGVRASAASWALREWAVSLSPVALAGGGAALGAALTALMAWPMRVLTPWWAWPSMGRQAALIFGAAAAGWALCRRGD